MTADAPVSGVTNPAVSWFERLTWQITGNATKQCDPERGQAITRIIIGTVLQMKASAPLFRIRSATYGIRFTEHGIWTARHCDDVQHPIEGFPTRNPNSNALSIARDRGNGPVFHFAVCLPISALHPKTGSKGSDRLSLVPSHKALVFFGCSR